MKDEELKKQADEILHTFNHKKYDGDDLMVIIAYILVKILTPVSEQNGMAKTIGWLNSLHRIVMLMLYHTGLNKEE